MLYRCQNGVVRGSRVGWVGWCGDVAGRMALTSYPMLISDDDRWLFSEGAHSHLHEVLGAQPLTDWSDPGRRFSVWAPSASKVWVIGDFNGWQSCDEGILLPQGNTGIWAGQVAVATVGDRYKFRIVTAAGETVERADPLAFATELPPSTASVVTDLNYQWNDQDWLGNREAQQRHDQAISIYEMHVGSWLHPKPNQSFSWPELADPLADHLEQYGFTHVELMPIMEHPFYASWGYQTTSYFAPTARYGLPTEFMGFVDRLHQRGIGIILDWVPSHFPADEFALGNFDGTHLYEHGDPKEGWHPDWKSYIFNYGRHEVRSFLVSSAMSWIERYHIDGIRVDAVASMLYRDYSREQGEWVPNIYGGRENLEAIQFLREFNSAIGESHPDVLTIAEESTAFPGVTRPAADGGLGFHYKWDMGWMHDTLLYLGRDSAHRRYHHNEITFRSLYAFSEHYVLPLSHDEVVHGKGSILDKMHGTDDWQKFANLRLLYANQWLNPGKKLLYMGQEFGMSGEWNHDEPLAWSQIESPEHGGIANLVGALNRLYQTQPALHQRDNDAAGFDWVIMDDGENSVLGWIRHGEEGTSPVLCLLNLTPIVRENYRVGVPVGGDWQILLNTDDVDFGGSGVGQQAGGAREKPSQSGRIASATEPGAHGREQALSLVLPPFAALVLTPVLSPTNLT